MKFLTEIKRCLPNKIGTIAFTVKFKFQKASIYLIAYQIKNIIQSDITAPMIIESLRFRMFILIRRLFMAGYFRAISFSWLCTFLKVPLCWNRVSRVADAMFMISSVTLSAFLACSCSLFNISLLRFRLPPPFLAKNHSIYKSQLTIYEH